jgi:hypothetical protein
MCLDTLTASFVASPQKMKSMAGKNGMTQQPIDGCAKKIPFEIMVPQWN